MRNKTSKEALPPSKASALPSLDLSGKTKKQQAKVLANIGDIPDKHDRKRLESLLVQRATLCSEEKGLKKRRDELNKGIVEILDEYGLDGLFHEEIGVRVTYFQGSRTTVSAKELLSRGVDPILIQECSKVSTFPVVKVTVTGDSEEEEGE